LIRSHGDQISGIARLAVISIRDIPKSQLPLGIDDENGVKENRGHPLRAPKAWGQASQNPPHQKSAIGNARLLFNPSTESR
jgi:hypothetical protein